ncbi:MAG: hypothetical protein EPGJADBJ_02697 [Saprospiraceae bacterium]|nr:hypothetical protein [Saprospiraceae bacterium]
MPSSCTIPSTQVASSGPASTVLSGFTVTVTVIEEPVQLAVTGVMVKVTVTGNKVLLVSDPLISPLPLIGMPVTPGLSRVQLNVVPPTFPVITMVVMGSPEQTVCEAGVAIASGVGYTVTVSEAVAVQPGSPVTVTL